MRDACEINSLWYNLCTKIPVTTADGRPNVRAGRLKGRGTPANGSEML